MLRAIENTGFLERARGFLGEVDKLSTLGVLVCLEKGSHVAQAGLESVQNPGIWGQRGTETRWLAEKQSFMVGDIPLLSVTLLY